MGETSLLLEGTPADHIKAEEKLMKILGEMRLDGPKDSDLVKCAEYFVQLVLRKLWNSTVPPKSKVMCVFGTLLHVNHSHSK